MLMHQGRSAEALQQLDLAQHLNPTSNAVLAAKALALGYGGHQAEGVSLLESLVRSDPGAAAPHRNLAYLRAETPHNGEQFLAEMRRFAEIQGDTRMLHELSAAAAGMHQRGEVGMWTALLAQERKLQPEATEPTMLMADAEVALGHNDEALADLELLADQRDSVMMGLVIDPHLAPLRGDARFRRIATMLGLSAPETPLETVALGAPPRRR